MRRALKAAALVVLLAAAVAADERVSRTNEAITFDYKTTAKKTYELPVPGAGARVRMRVKATVREGEIRIVVRDAAGAVRQDARLGPSKKPTNYDVDSGVVKSPAGVWVVEVEMKEAVGGYEFSFTQNDE